jgi:hypothetical protein
MNNAVAARSFGMTAVAASIGLCSAAIVLAPSPIGWSIAIAAIAAPALLWIVAGPRRWVLLFFAAALLTPPLPFALGTAGPHAAVALAAAGLFCGLVRLSEWRNGSTHGVALALGVFVLVLLGSTGLAAVYSGPGIAAGSLARVALFAISIYLLLYTANGPGSADDWTPAARWLFWMAVAAAAFACVDFYFQFPAPAGFGRQFVWLDAGVVRRAQGLFYEASTLGNFCAFFAVMLAVAFSSPRSQRPASTLALVGAGIVFCSALLLSYSRASLVNVVVALGALAYVRRIRLRSFLWFALGGAACATLLLYLIVPQFVVSYALRLSASVQYFWSSPNAVLSGRIANWMALIDFLGREPWHAIVGIGYKTLPYSDYTGGPLIADNTYLSLLVETGVIGLAVFVALNVAILRASFRAARSANPSAAFFGTWVFCFWAGETVQMMSGDLITYWRVLPLYFWALGVAVANERSVR